MDSFKALLIEERDGKVTSGFTTLDESKTGTKTRDNA